MRQDGVPSAGLVFLHQREAQRLLWHTFFGRALRAGTVAVEVGGAETFVDTGRQGRINIAVGVSGTSVAKFPVRGTLQARWRNLHNFRVK